MADPTSALAASAFAGAPPAYRALIGTDVAAAVLLAVLAPLALLLAARLRGEDGVRRRLVVAWRAAALLLAALYLLLAAHPLAFAAGALARAVLPLALFLPTVWPGVSEPPPPATALGRSFRLWRAVTAAWSALSLVAILPLLRCTFEWRLDDACRAWAGPAAAWSAFVHPWLDAGAARPIGLALLVLWLLGLGLFLLRKTPWLRR